MRAGVVLSVFALACARDPEEPEVAQAEISVACAATDNPLRFICAVDVEPPQAVTLEVTPTDGLGYVAPPFASNGTSDQHDVPVYLLRPEQTYGVTARGAGDPTLTAHATFTTEVPHSAADSALTISGASTSPLIGTEIPCNNQAIAVIYDTVTGDLVWYQNLDLDGQLGFADMFRFTDERTVIADTDGNVVEVDLTGNLLLDVPQPDGLEFNHDLSVYGDGIFLLTYDQDRLMEYTNGLTLDAVTHLDRKGAVVAKWFAGDTLTVPFDATGNWLHANSLSIGDGGDLYVNFLEQQTVAKLSGDLEAFGATEWMMSLGPTPSPIGSDFTVDWSQVDGPDFAEFAHWFHQRRDGRWTTLDNNNGRSLILSLDEPARSAVVEASFPAPLEDCDGQGTATETWSGNPVVGCGKGPVREYDLATAALLWEAEVVCPDRSVPTMARWYPLAY